MKKTEQALLEARVEMQPQAPESQHSDPEWQQLYTAIRKAVLELRPPKRNET